MLMMKRSINFLVWRQAHLAALALTAVMVAGCSSPSTPARADREDALETYLARPEPLYKWEKDGGGQPTNGSTMYDLKLTSQEWQGMPWTHRVQVFRPAHVEFPDTALLLVTGGDGSPQETLLGQIVADSIGATFVTLYNIPNQPLFERREDDLIAYTFQKYLETGDATWPLLLPMTKSVVKAMDALQEFSQQEWKQPITKFVVTGASKRGWTTWLAGAADKRVSGIIPMVYDNLNLAAQMPHQLEVWGQYSEQIADYTRRGLQAQMKTPRGAELGAMVDPWTYRERIATPKLVINGTNDPYWTLDAFNLYREGLKGQTNVLYVPNAGHNLLAGPEQQQRVLGTATGWFRRVAAGQETPSVELAAGPVEEARTPHNYLLTTKAQPAAVRMWVAHSATGDFRQSTWQSLPMKSQATEGENRVYVADTPPLPAGAKQMAVFGEIDIDEGNPLPLRLSSPVIIWSTQTAQGAAKDAVAR
jgi:PhoPQ-activated pathogenicity-related protein